MMIRTGIVGPVVLLFILISSPLSHAKSLAHQWQIGAIFGFTEIRQKPASPRYIYSDANFLDSILLPDNAVIGISSTYWLSDRKALSLDVSRWHSESKSLEYYYNFCPVFQAISSRSIYPIMASMRFYFPEFSNMGSVRQYWWIGLGQLLAFESLDKAGITKKHIDPQWAPSALIGIGLDIFTGRHFSINLTGAFRAAGEVAWEDGSRTDLAGYLFHTGIGYRWGGKAE